MWVNCLGGKKHSSYTSWWNWATLHLTVAELGSKGRQSWVVQASCEGIAEIWILSWRLFMYFTLSRNRKFLGRPEVPLSATLPDWLRHFLLVFGCVTLTYTWAQGQQEGLSVSHSFYFRVWRWWHFIGSRSCKFKSFQAEKGCIAPCVSSVVQEVTDNSCVRVLSGKGCCPLSWSAA